MPLSPDRQRTRRSTTPRAAALLLLLAGCAPARPDTALRAAAAPEAPAAAASGALVVYVVRHAERLDASRDPVLSEAGRARAAALAAALADAGIGAVVTTQFVRTQETAAPLVRALRLEAEVVPATAAVDEHAADVARAVLAVQDRGAVLVVGHSNTVPSIVAALGGPQFADLCDADYDNLFIVVLQDGQAARLTRARFGAADGDTGCGGMPPL